MLSIYRPHPPGETIPKQTQQVSCVPVSFILSKADSLPICWHIRLKAFLNCRVVLNSFKGVMITNLIFPRQIGTHTCTHQIFQHVYTLTSDNLFSQNNLVHVNMSRLPMFPAEKKSNCFLYLLDALGSLHWLVCLVGNERFWQPLKLPQTPPADSQYLLLTQYNLFIPLQPLFQFDCQDCVRASSHDN